MPQVPLEFASGSFPSIDEAVLDGKLTARFYDGYEDEVGAKYKRPAFTAFTATAIQTPVQGLFWSEFLGCYIAVGNGVLYKITTDAVISTITGVTMDNHNPAQFTENGTVVYVTVGAKMVTTDGTTAAEVTDVAAPTVTTHLGWIDGHVLTNQSGSNYFWWADIGTGVWDINNSEAANGDIDKIVAILTYARELYLIGTRSTEIWVNTGETPGTFQRLQGAFISRGCSAPYTVMIADNTVWWLDHERAFVRLEGRNPKVVSGPVNSLLRGLADVSDLTAHPFQYLDRRFILLSSKANNFTLIYDYVKDAWYQWGVWNETTEAYDRWPVQSIAFSPLSNTYLCLNDDGKVYSLGGNATDARFCLRSAHVSHGTYDWKLCRNMTIRLKRGYLTTSPVSVIRVRWRDQGQTWSSWHSIPLNDLGEYDNVAKLHRLGRYRTRQYEFVQSDANPFALVGVTEEIEGTA